jgi:hypothetical protein
MLPTSVSSCRDMTSDTFSLRMASMKAYLKIGNLSKGNGIGNTVQKMSRSRTVFRCSE